MTPASGRQDHTTSPYATTSFVSAPFDRSRILVRPALHHVSRLTLPRPPHPHPASVTIAIRPSVGWDTKSSRSDLGQMGTEIFFGKSEIRLDTARIKRPSRSSKSHSFAAVFGKRGAGNCGERDCVSAEGLDCPHSSLRPPTLSRRRKSRVIHGPCNRTVPRIFNSCYYYEHEWQSKTPPLPATATNAGASR